MKSAHEPRRSPAPSAPRAHQQGKGDDLWLLLIEFALNLRGWWVTVCDTLDLTPTQGLALRTLNPETPMAMNALAETLACDASNVTGVVDKLEARGLIERRAAEGDRRVKMLVVTERGRDLRRKLFDEAAKPPALIAALPKDLRDRMSGLLRAVIDERKPLGATG
jgi:DNA-binding MarR family transcriptional regulator